MAYTICLDELANPEPIYRTCMSSPDPIFVSAKGDGDKMVIMNYASYSKLFAKVHIYQALEEGERDIAAGRTMDAFEHLESLRSRCCA